MCKLGLDVNTNIDKLVYTQGEANGRWLYTGRRLDYRLRLWLLHTHCALSRR